MAKRLVIDLNHIELASRQLDQAADTPRGELAWEFALSKQLPAYWACIERLLIGSGEYATEVRKLLTFVYGAVHASAKTFPRMDESHWKEVLGLYATEQNQRAGLQAWERGAALLGTASAWWAQSFEDLVRTSIARLDGRLTKQLWCAVIVLMGKVLDEPFKPTVPDPIQGTDETSFRNVKSTPSATVNNVAPVISDVSFDDVGGHHRAKVELIRLASRFNQPAIGRRWGEEPIRAFALYGPEGTGKTLLVHALASAIHLPFFSINVAEVLIKWVNESHQTLFEYFKSARASGGAFLFFDEADAILGTRGRSSCGEDDKVVNQWNQCLTSLTADDRILCGLATNRVDILDKAAVRDGRVDLMLEVPAPQTDQERREIFKACMRRVENRAGQPVFKENVNLFHLAKQTPGLTGAIIANIVNVAVRTKVDEELAGKQPGFITTEDLLEALDQRNQMRPDKNAKAIGFRSGPSPLPEAIGVFEPMKPKF